MKAITKKILAVLCCMVLCLTIILLTSCDNNANNNEQTGTKATSAEIVDYVATSANNYLQNRKDGNFTDTTYVFSKKQRGTEENILTYKKNASDTETVTEKLVEKHDVDSKATIYIKKFDEDYAMVSTTERTIYNEDYEVNTDNTLKITRTTTVVNVNLTLAPFTDGNNKTYCLVVEENTTTKTEGQENATSTSSKEKYTFANKADYDNEMTDIFSKVNDRVISTFFGYFQQFGGTPSSNPEIESIQNQLSIVEMMITQGGLIGTKKGDDLTLNYEMNFVTIGNSSQDYDVNKMMGSQTMEFKNHNINTCTASSFSKVGETSTGNVYQQLDLTITVENGANPTIISDLTDYTEKASLIMTFQGDFDYYALY